ncbi:hypothetical protein CGZ91_03650 [Parenemella sanctibonifatiensis]|uniref:Uncharacterized protein n=1 Tax=Parenemella sanctibonifatiensis TaxID=2016505 RepID=A0A255ET32_9ACTN|nr:hypothetical protein CGZ91_03650 [Parenemella sanctibonifatiensis]
MLHPVGPEGQSVYWLRRGVVLAVTLVLVVGLGVGVTLLNGGSGQAQPLSAPTTEQSPSSTEPNASENSGEGDLPPGDPLPEETPGEAPESSESQTDQAPAERGGGFESPAPAPAPESAPAPEGEPHPEQEPAPGPEGDQPAPAPAPEPAPEGPHKCDPKAVTLVLMGERRTPMGAPAQLQLSAINNAEQACELTLDQSNTELLITSGKDRIWSSRDCQAWFPTKQAMLEPQQAVDWTMEWTVQRSQGCKLSDSLNPGTYVATISLADGATERLVLDVVRG